MHSSSRGASASSVAIALRPLPVPNASSRQGRSTRVTLTAAAFSSGCFDSGSNAGWVSVFTPNASRPPRKRRPQCIGRNTCPLRWSSLASTCTWIAPRFDSTFTQSPTASARRAMSRGCMANRGSGACAKARAWVPLRLIACHWSRSRPVFSRSGQRASTLSAGGRHGLAMKRARPLAVGNWPSAYSRTSPQAAPSGIGHCCGPAVSSTAHDNPVMSRSRPRVVSRCSFHTASASCHGNSVGRPGRRRASSRRAKSRAITQSARASPGGGTAARTRLIRRSELVTVPSFSPQLEAGSSRSA